MCTYEPQPALLVRWSQLQVQGLCEWQTRTLQPLDTRPRKTESGARVDVQVVKARKPRDVEDKPSTDQLQKL